MDEVVVNYIKQTYSLMIGERTAEEVKIQIGTAYLAEEGQTMDIRGRDLVTGLPKTLTITAVEIEKALVATVYQILSAIKFTLEQSPPELASDIMDKGIVMTGGGALLKGLDKLVARETGMPVFLSDNPLDSVALGVGKALAEIDLLHRVAVAPRKIS